jgi:hypothetical protein
MKEILYTEDYSKIVSKQLQVLDSGNATEADVKIAEAIFNGVGKALKKAALRMAYHSHIKEGGDVIEELERHGKK